MADALDLGSSAARRGGSSPPSRTISFRPSIIRVFEKSARHGPRGAVARRRAICPFFAHFFSDSPRSLVRTDRLRRLRVGDHHEPELFALLRRAFGYLDRSEPNLRAVSHFETELARITGVHDAKMLKNNPAFALGNLFGKLPLSRTPLLKALASDTKIK